jgi:hypothetical protein
MARLVLGDTALKVGIGALSASCPNFKEELPCHVRSPVSVEAFQVFVGALEGTVPVVTTETMQDLFLLCEEFGFFGLLSQVTDFISAHSVADFAARKYISEESTATPKTLFAAEGGCRLDVGMYFLSAISFSQPPFLPMYPMRTMSRLIHTFSRSLSNKSAVSNSE